MYQWMPFYVAGLAVLYYLPYILHAYSSSDLQSFRAIIKDENLSDQEKTRKVVRHYFGRRNKDKCNYRFRVLASIAVKISYLTVGLTAFFGTDNLLYNGFASYGVSWVKWSSLNNTYAHDYMGLRDFPKPGNALLPPFGYCEVWESALDKLVSKTNHFKFVCELSQNVLYQYCFVLLWWMMVIGIVLASLSLAWLLVQYTLHVTRMRRWTSPISDIYHSLTLRELCYLDYLAMKNTPIFNDVQEELRKLYTVHMHPRVEALTEEARDSGCFPDVLSARHRR